MVHVHLVGYGFGVVASSTSGVHIFSCRGNRSRNSALPLRWVTTWWIIEWYHIEISDWVQGPLQDSGAACGINCDLVPLEQNIKIMVTEGLDRQ